jgi:hypothetical protein
MTDPIDPDFLQYEKIVEDALRGVVRTALTQVSDFGLPGSHSLYVSFLTGFPGVDIPDKLRADYPEEMTIVLEHQFWDLNIFDTAFEVTLSFDRRKQRLFVPFAAVTSFADPSVPFGLKFEVADGEAEEEVEEANAAPPANAEAQPIDEDAAGEVINLDAFRKK